MEARKLSPHPNKSVPCRPHASIHTHSHIYHRITPTPPIGTISIPTAILLGSLSLYLTFFFFRFVVCVSRLESLFVPTHVVVCFTIPPSISSSPFLSLSLAILFFVLQSHFGLLSIYTLVVLNLFHTERQSLTKKHGALY